jgi:ADP-heptose:LPS heptosyltransferase
MKIWPIEKFKCLIELILNRYDCDIFLIGGKADFEYNNILLNMIANSNNIRNVAGKFSIEETIDLMINSDILIGNDGFPLHLAALCNIPIVGIFSYKNPIGCWDPIIASKMITIRSYATCKECYLEECDNPVCVKYISVNSIIRSIDKILESPSISSIEIQNIGNNLNRDFLQPNFLNKNNII